MKQKRAILYSGLGIIALLIVVGISLSVVSQIKTSYSLKQFFPSEHNLLKISERIQKKFLLTEQSPFLILLHSNENLLQKKYLTAIRNISNELKTIPNVRSVISLPQIEMASIESKEIKIGPLFEILPPKQWSSFIEKSILLQPQLISDDFKTTTIILEPQTSSTVGLEKIRIQIRKHLTSLPSGIHAEITGVPALQLDISKKIQKEVGFFLVLCLVSFALLLFIFYKNFSAVLFGLGGLIIVNLSTLGLLAMIHISLNALLVTLPILISICFVSILVHTLPLWAQKISASQPSSFTSAFLLSLSTLKEILLSNFLSTLTTAIGFSTLALSYIPAIREYALVVSVAVIWTFLVGHFYFLCTMALIRPQLRNWNFKKAWWGLSFIKYNKIILISLLGAVVFFLSFSPHINFSTQLFDDLPKGIESRKAITKVDSKMGGSVPLEVSLKLKTNIGWKEQKAFVQLQKSLSEIRKVDGVGTAISFPDFFKETPRNSGLLSEALFLFSMSSSDPLKSYMDANYKTARISIRLTDLPTKKVEKVREQIKGIIIKNIPQVEIQQSGLAVTSHTINKEVSQELVWGFWQSLIIIASFLLLFFKSWRWALFSMLPNLLPPLALIGILGLTQTPIKPTVALIFSIALGLSFNNTVYLLVKLRSLMKEKKLSFLPLKRAFLEEGNPCLAESFVTLFGFGIFLFSDFKLNQVFGGYMIISILAGAIGDLVFLPAFLKFYPKILLRKKPFPIKISDSHHAFATVKNIVVFFIILGSALCILFPQKLFAQSVDDILKTSRKQLESMSDQAQIELKIIEANGDTKVRKLQMKSLKSKNGFKALVKVTYPNDVKGTSLLSEVKNGEDSQWIYLPASKQVRRIASVQKNSSNGILGSELSSQDLDWSALRGSKPKIIKKDRSGTIIELRPSQKISEYKTIHIYLAEGRYLPLKIQYFKNNKLAKSLEFQDYYMYQNKVFRPKKVIVKNHENQRKTLVQLSDIKINQKISEDEFSMQALKRSAM